MNAKEHKIYLEEFKAYAKRITATKNSTKDFLVRAGINTPSGRLTKAYSSKGVVIKNNK